MNNPARSAPISILKHAITNTDGVLDPKGAKGLMHYTQVIRNGKKYNLEVLYDKATNTIMHFNYRRDAMEPLKKFLTKMFKKNDKKRLYWLIKQYLSGKMDSNTFCDEYYYCYDLELDHESLSETERKVFKELSFVSGRFSPYKGDIEQYPGVYFTSTELWEKVQEAQEKLASEHFEIRRK